MARRLRTIDTNCAAYSARRALFACPPDQQARSYFHHNTKNTPRGASILWRVSHGFSHPVNGTPIDTIIVNDFAVRFKTFIYKNKKSPKWGIFFTHQILFLFRKICINTAVFIFLVGISVRLLFSLCGFIDRFAQLHCSFWQRISLGFQWFCRRVCLG